MTVFALDPAKYAVRHVSEVDEPVHNDCLVAAGLMWLEALVGPEILSGPDWSPLTNPEIRQRREAMRNLLPPDKQTGPLGVGELRAMVGITFPFIPEPTPFYDADHLNTAEQALALIRGGSVGLSLGNPSRVTNAASKLRKWTRSDDYDHWIYLDRATADAVYIFNPLAPYGIGYDGEWIPVAEWKQYATVIKGSADVQTLVEPRGKWSPTTRMTVALTDAFTKKLTRAQTVARDAVQESQRLTGNVETLTRELSNAQGALSKSQTALTKASADLAACRASTPDCAAQVEAAVAPLRDRIGRAQAASAATTLILTEA